MDKTFDISVIIPFYNEEENIIELCSILDTFNLQLSNEGISCEIILIDDGSKDSSLRLLLDKKNSLNFVCKVIKLSKNFGSHSAIRAGILNSRGIYTTILSSDMQEPIDLVHNLYKTCKKGFDIVYAKRNKVEVEIVSKIFSKIYSSLVKIFIFKDFPKNGLDIVMFNEKVKNVFNKSVESNSNYILQLLSLGFIYTFIDYEKTNRKKGKSKWKLANKLKLIVDSFISFSYLPIRFVSIIGVLFFLSGIMWTTYIILRKLIVGDLASGWPTLISILLLGFGITNISLGIVAEYLWRTLDVSRNRPIFIIDEIIELT